MRLWSLPRFCEIRVYYAHHTSQTSQYSYQLVVSILCILRARRVDYYVCKLFTTSSYYIHTSSYYPFLMFNRPPGSRLLSPDAPIRLFRVGASGPGGRDALGACLLTKKLTKCAYYQLVCIELYTYSTRVVVVVLYDRSMHTYYVYYSLVGVVQYAYVLLLLLSIASTSRSSSTLEYYSQYAYQCMHIVQIMLILASQYVTGLTRQKS